jgi:hypothetical protein
MANATPAGSFLPSGIPAFRTDESRASAERGG